MTYDEVATHYGVTLCPAYGHGDCIVAEVDHRQGAVMPRTTVLHWTPRRVTKHGLRQFLKVVSRTRLLNYYAMNPAMRLYAENSWATRAAAELHVRFPAAYTTTDRLRIRWLVAKGATITPQARRWAWRTT